MLIMGYQPLRLLLGIALTTGNFIGGGQAQRSRPRPSDSATAALIRILFQNSKAAIRPLDGTDEPVCVNISVQIQNYRAVDEEHMEFSIDLFFRQSWNDPRLQYDADGIVDVTLTRDVAQENLWMPDVFFSNSHGSNLHSLREDSIGFKVRPNGDVLMSSRTHVLVHCDMDLRDFPLDTQECRLLLESYMYSTENQVLQWKATDGLTLPQTRNPQAFTVLKVDKGNCQEPFGSTLHSCLFASFTVQRISTHWLTLVYAPCILLVILSCLVFWMPLHALLERTFLSSFLLLAVVPIMTGSQYGTPQTGILKAIDVWLIVCFVFLFAALLEVVALQLLRVSTRSDREDSFELMKEDELPRGQGRSQVDRKSWMVRPGILRQVDVALRVVYPAAFVVFNAIYWAVYCN